MNIKIICREIDSRANRLYNLFSKYGSTEIIPHNGIQDEGYRGICRSVGHKRIEIDLNNKEQVEFYKKQAPFLKIQKVYTDNKPFEWVGTTAWDLAFKNIETEDTLFIEEDVATNDSFLKPFFEFLQGDGAKYDLVTTEVERRADSAWWWYWDDYLNPIPIFQNERKSFNPFCFLRKSLIKQVIEFRNKYGCFIFHEILFPSLANNPYDLKDNPHFNLLFFRWRIQGKIYTPYLNRALVHSVKQDSEHKKICDNTGKEVIINFD